MLGFAVEFCVASWVGGNEFLLKMRAAVLTGPIGIALLVSALIGKPLLVPILRLIRPAALVRSGALDRLSSDRATRRKVTLATAIFGLASHAVVAITLAWMLPNGSYLIVSKIANWTLAGIVVGLLLLLRRRHPG